MATPTMHNPLGIDLSNVEPAETRRAVRQVLQMLNARLEEQQTEIEALIEMLVDRHVVSVGELKSYIRRMQQRDDKAARLHSVMSQAVRTTTPREDIGASIEDAGGVPDDRPEQPRVYRL